MTVSHSHAHFVHVSFPFTATGAEWTDEDLSLLAKALRQLPAGTQRRWEKVAEFMGTIIACYCVLEAMFACVIVIFPIWELLSAC